MTGWWVGNDKTVMEVEDVLNGHYMIKRVIATEHGYWTAAVGQSPFLYEGYFVITEDEVIRLIFEKKYEKR